MAPIQAIERKVSIIVSLISDCRGSCGGLVAEDGGDPIFFHCQTVLQFVETVGNSNFLFCGLYKPYNNRNVFFVLRFVQAAEEKKICTVLRFVQTAEEEKFATVLRFVQTVE